MVAAMNNPVELYVFKKVNLALRKELFASLNDRETKFVSSFMWNRLCKVGIIEIT